MVLSPGSALPRCRTPSTPAWNSATTSAASAPSSRHSRAGAQKEGAVERAGGAAHVRMSTMAAVLSRRRCRRRLGGQRRRLTAVKPRSMLMPWSASPMAESRSVRCCAVLRVDALQALQPGQHVAACRRSCGQIPQRRPGVSTGSSHSESISSSALSSVSEQPAISRLVM